jgi:predicted transcriptional regulator
MSTLSIRLAESLHERLRVLAKKEQVSINQLISTAVAEKLSALDTEDYLQERAGRASKAKFKKALRKVPDVEPGEEDRLP